MNFGKLIGAAFKAAKANPSLVVSAVTAIGPVIAAVKSEAKKQKANKPAA